MKFADPREKASVAGLLSMEKPKTVEEINYLLDNSRKAVKMYKMMSIFSFVFTPIGLLLMILPGLISLGMGLFFLKNHKKMQKNIDEATKEYASANGISLT
jgi:hypothetical protein